MQLKIFRGNLLSLEILFNEFDRKMIGIFKETYHELETFVLKSDQQTDQIKICLLLICALQFDVLEVSNVLQ